MNTWWCSKDDLDDDQKKVMQLGVEGSYWVSGPPGSGKTNLLLMRAAYLALKRQSICVVVLTRSLAEFLRSGASRYKMSPDSVLTYSQFVKRLAAEAGLPPLHTDSFDELRTQSIEILKSLDQKDPIFDVILIDEAQDYSPEELKAIRSLAFDAFFTTDIRQRIYPQSDQIHVLDSLVNDHLELKFHYRNSPGICELADRIGQQFAAQHKYQKIAPGCRYPTSAPKEEIAIVQSNFDDQVREIVSRIRVQLRAYPNELIGIVAPKMADVKQLYEALKQSVIGPLLTVQIGNESVLDFSSSKQVVLSTVHAAKGLEFRAVHFPCADHVKTCGANQKRIAFTAVTRAKTSLTIYHSEPLPGWFEKAVSIYRQGGNAPDDWEAIF